MKNFLQRVSHQASKSPAKACRKTDGIVGAAVLIKDICADLYVLVQLFFKFGKIITQYRHVGVFQSDMDEDWEIRVQFLTTIDGKGVTKIVNDKANVQFEDIIARLKAPEKTTDGNNMFVEFSVDINVFEKKQVT
ncbi:hypothetical protein TNIN_215051 [Trichonephila inaurata madagascariensis]|uniref:Uncharacterized protein n=1 Tax=Trichonephila inaurata madagascariensis TaxID=2747483 RepID=A0A8X6JMV8_9ARAC|nr:hypothetical protein TNIN_215051 [Trichonephila inaurata madagascariensis]